MLNVCQVFPETLLCMIFLIIRPVLSSLTFAERLVFPSSLRSAMENTEEGRIEKKFFSQFRVFSNTRFSTRQRRKRKRKTYLDDFGDIFWYSINTTMNFRMIVGVRSQICRKRLQGINRIVVGYSESIDASLMTMPVVR